MSPGSHCYFDHYQGEPKKRRTNCFGGYTLKKSILQLTPIELSAEEAKYILMHKPIFGPNI
jgi:hexosaminidase